LAGPSAAFSAAERGLIEQMPSGLSSQQVDFALTEHYNLVGFWFEDSRWCTVYDVKPLERMRSPHMSGYEVLEERLDSIELLGKFNIEYGVNERKNVYVRVHDCPLCL
jgi:hypothetical protein